MKKWIIVAALATAILASCTKNEVRVDAPDQAISFTTAVGANSTKAMINDTAYPNSETFGTYAYYLPAGQNWAANAGNAKLYIPESEVRYTDNIVNEGCDWTTTTPYYWPSAGSLTFFSFSPWSINTSVECNTTNGIKITGWDVDANQTVDVMVADVAEDKTANETNPGGVGYNGVPTVFRHKLSQIVAFKFNTDKDYTNDNGDGTWAAGDKQIVVTGISINSIATKGTFTSGPNPSVTSIGNWTEQSEDNTYTWYEDAAGTTIEYNVSSYATAVTPNQALATNGYLLVLPQTFGDTETITLKYTIKTYNGTGWVDDKVTKTIKLKDIHAASGAATGSEAFEMNKKITYNFTIGLNQIYWAPSVVDWESESHDISVR